MPRLSQRLRLASRLALLLTGIILGSISVATTHWVQVSESWGGAGGSGSVKMDCSYGLLSGCCVRADGSGTLCTTYGQTVTVGMDFASRATVTFCVCVAGLLCGVAGAMAMLSLLSCRTHGHRFRSALVAFTTSALSGLLLMAGFAVGQVMRVDVTSAVAFSTTGYSAYLACLSGVILFGSSMCMPGPMQKYVNQNTGDYGYPPGVITTAAATSAVQVTMPLLSVNTTSYSVAPVQHGKH